MSVRSVASFIPAAGRAAIYTLIGAAVALEAVWDLVPEVLEGKVLKSFTVLGFGLAVANTGD